MGAKCSKTFSKPFTNLRKLWRKNKVEPLPQHLSNSEDPTPPLRKWPTQELAVEEAEAERQRGGDNTFQGCIIKSDETNMEVGLGGSYKMYVSNILYILMMAHLSHRLLKRKPKGERGEKSISEE